MDFLRQSLSIRWVKDKTHWQRWIHTYTVVRCDLVIFRFGIDTQKDGIEKCWMHVILKQHLYLGFCESVWTCFCTSPLIALCSRREKYADGLLFIYVFGCTYFSQSKHRWILRTTHFFTRTGTLGTGTAEYSDSLIVFPSMSAGLSEKDLFWLTAGLRLGPLPCSATASETHDHKVRSLNTR